MKKLLYYGFEDEKTYYMVLEDEKTILWFLFRKFEIPLWWPGGNLSSLFSEEEKYLKEHGFYETGTIK